MQLGRKWCKCKRTLSASDVSRVGHGPLYGPCPLRRSPCIVTIGRRRLIWNRRDSQPCQLVCHRVMNALGRNLVLGDNWKLEVCQAQHLDPCLVESCPIHLLCLELGGLKTAVWKVRHKNKRTWSHSKLQASRQNKTFCADAICSMPVKAKCVHGCI